MGTPSLNQPYFPTLPSTSEDIKKKCMSYSPKEVVSSIDNSAGGIIDATYPGQLPRNEQQVSNFKRRVPISTGQKLSDHSESNELYSIMLQAHLEDRNKSFIRDVKAYPEPAIVLATEQQLLDLERFCCDSTDFCILTVDPTFSLGDYDVTPTTYRHLMLSSKRTCKPPVMLGPTMIHYRKNFSTYKFFASCMIGWNRNLVGLRALGTDGEKPLFDAFLHEFKSAVHLTCFNHVRRNIKHKLHDAKIPDDVQTEILNDIFGQKMGSTLLTGLVDLSSRYSFEEKLSTLLIKWKQHDMDNDEGPVSLFCSWFRTNKEEVIRDTMNKEQRNQWLKKFNKMAVLAAGDAPTTSQSAFMVDTGTDVSLADDTTKMQATTAPLSTAYRQSCLPSVSQPVHATMLSKKLCSFQ